MKKIFLLVIVLFSFFAVAQPQKTKKDSLFHSIGALISARLELEVQAAQAEFSKELREATEDGTLSRIELFDVEAKKRRVEDMKDDAKEELDFYGLKLNEDFNLVWTEEDVDVWDAIDSLNRSVDIFLPYYPENSIKNLQKMLVIKYHKPIIVSFSAHLFSFFVLDIFVFLFSLSFYLSDRKNLYNQFFITGLILLLVVLINLVS